jgi:hypothetical protein
MEKVVLMFKLVVHVREGELLKKWLCSDPECINNLDNTVVNVKVKERSVRKKIDVRPAREKK